MNTSGITHDTALAWSAIRIEGPDAETFLQSQLSQDVSGLDDQGRWSLLLRPDGIVVTSAWLRSDGNDYELIVPRGLGDAALARLRRFHLRAKCTLDLIDVPKGPWDSESQLINEGWPGEHEFLCELAPQSFGSRFIEKSVSFTKGCYTGQELVARLNARGSNVPWRLVRVIGPTLERIDEVLHAKGPEGPQGVTTLMQDSGAARALGIAHRSLLSADVLAPFSDVAVEIL